MFHKYPCLRNNMITFPNQLLPDFFDVFVITGFHNDLQIAACYVFAARPFVMDRNNISSHSGNNSGYSDQLTGTVCQFYRKRIRSSGFEKPSVDDTGKNRYVDVSAGYKANHLFPFDRNFIEHGGCHRYSTSSFGYQFLLFDKRQYCRRDFIIGYGNDPIDIFVADVIGMNTRFFYGEIGRASCRERV